MEGKLLDIILINYKNKSNADVINSLETSCKLLSSISDKNIIEVEEALYEINRAIGISKGYTEYVKNKLSSDLGISKTAIKYIVKQLINENKIEVVTIGEISFIKPII